MFKTTKQYHGSSCNDVVNRNIGRKLTNLQQVWQTWSHIKAFLLHVMFRGWTAKEFNQWEDIFQVYLTCSDTGCWCDRRIQILKRSKRTSCILSFGFYLLFCGCFFFNLTWFLFLYLYCDYCIIPQICILSSVSATRVTNQLFMSFRGILQFNKSRLQPTLNAS